MPWLPNDLPAFPEDPVSGDVNRSYKCSRAIVFSGAEHEGRTGLCSGGRRVFRFLYLEVMVEVPAGERFLGRFFLQEIPPSEESGTSCAGQKRKMKKPF